MMCHDSDFCTKLGKDPEEWDRECPLPPPIFFEDSLNYFIKSYEMALKGQKNEAVIMLEKTRSEDLRDWYVKHGQMSGFYRMKAMQDQPETKYSGQLELQKDFSPYEPQIYSRDGYMCGYCNSRVIDTRVLIKMEKMVGRENFRPVGRGNQIRHGVALVFRATIDHIKPLSKGGRTLPDNLVTSCWSCNYGKAEYLLQDLLITNPLDRPSIKRTQWDGLTSTL